MIKKHSFLMTLALVGGIFSLASCGGQTDNKKEDDKPSDTTTETTISYQLVGEYTDDTLKGYGFDYFYLLNLYSDNTISYSGYNQLGMNTSSYKTNTSFSEEWGTGKWENTKDVEDEDCIKITLLYGSSVSDTLKGKKFTYEVYPDASNNITFTIDVPFQSGRQAKISGGTTIKYKDYDEFIKAYSYVENLPENPLAVLEDSSTHYRVYCTEDKVASLYSGRLDPGTSTYKYLVAKSGTYHYTSSKLYFTFENDIEATIDGKKVTLNYTYSMGGQYSIDLTLTCDDGSKLFVESEAPVDENLLCTFTNSENEKLSLKVYKDKTATFQGSFSSTPFTWVYDSANNQLVFTEVNKEGTPKVVNAPINDDNSCTFVFSNKFGDYELGGTVTCADVSVLKTIA